MITDKKIKANRENAKKGGIKTPAWKQRSKMNAVKHGLSSKELVDNSEKMEYLKHLFALRDEYWYLWIMADFTIERMAFNYAKIQRSKKIEELYETRLVSNRAATNNIRLDDYVKKFWKNEMYDSIVEMEDIFWDIPEVSDLEDLEKLTRYINTLENSYIKFQKRLIELVKLNNELN